MSDRCIYNLFHFGMLEEDIKNIWPFFAERVWSRPIQKILIKNTQIFFTKGGGGGPRPIQKTPIRKNWGGQKRRRGRGRGLNFLTKSKKKILCLPLVEEWYFEFWWFNLNVGVGGCHKSWNGFYTWKRVGKNTLFMYAFTTRGPLVPEPSCLL